MSELRSLLTPRGTLVIIGNEDGGRISGGMGRVLHAALLNLFVEHRLRSRIATEAKRDLEAGKASGKVVISIP